MNKGGQSHPTQEQECNRATYTDVSEGPRSNSVGDESYFNVTGSGRQRWTREDLAQMEYQERVLEAKILSLNIEFSDDSIGVALKQLWEQFEMTVDRAFEQDASDDQDSPQTDSDITDQHSRQTAGSSDASHVLKRSSKVGSRTGISHVYETNKEVRLVFRQYFSRFKLVYGDPQKWNTSVYAANFEQQQQDAERKRLSGQVAGHPQRMIRTLCQLFQDEASDLVSAFNTLFQTIKERAMFPSPEGLIVLEALEIVCRSPVNRIFVHQYNVMPCVIHITRTALSLLNQITTGTDKELSDIWNCALNFIKDTLVISISILEHYAEREHIAKREQGSKSTTNSQLQRQDRKSVV